MRKKKYFQKIYNYDQEKRCYLIEVSLDDYNDVYDDWDPSPFKKRDIEDEFNDFIVNSSEDIPLNHNICIVLYLPNNKKNEKKEMSLVSAYKNYYNFTIHRLNKSKLNLHKKAALYLLFSFSFLSIGYFFSGKKSNILFSVLHEGIFIGGWVFLWEFFTDMFITARELKKEYKLYERLHDAEIKFIYK